MKLHHAIIVAIELSIALSTALAQNVTSNGTPAFNSFGGGPDVIHEGKLNIYFTMSGFARAGRGMSFSQWLPGGNGVWYKYTDIYGNWHWGADLATAQPTG